MLHAYVVSRFSLPQDTDVLKSIQLLDQCFLKSPLNMVT